MKLKSKKKIDYRLIYLDKILQESSKILSNFLLMPLFKRYWNENATN